MTNFYKKGRIFFLMIFLFLNHNSFAQHIGSSSMDSVRNNQHTTNATYTTAAVTDTNALIEQKLVELALTQPSFDEAEDQITIADRQLKKAKNSWLNLLSISTNINEQSFAPQTSTNQTQYVYPKYFFGVNIPLGLIFLSGAEIKIARTNVKINQDRQEELARTIKADVLSKYAQYKAYSQLIELQTQTIDDEQASYLQAEQKFKDGTITIDVYNGASKNYNFELAKKIDLQLQQNVTKLEIEKMIGIPLEDVLKLKYTPH